MGSFEFAYRFRIAKKAPSFVGGGEPVVLLGRLFVAGPEVLASTVRPPGRSSATSENISYLGREEYM